MQLPKVTAIILNTNRRDDTLACLASLLRSSYPRLSVMVLDNASTDGSTAAIQAAHPAVQVVSLPENRGYTGNNNVGVQRALDAGADWVFVLNEDTILAPDCITHLVAAAEAEPQIGIVGPLVYHHDEPNIIQSAGGRLTRFWEARHIALNEVDRQQFTAPHAVDWISGCAILVRRSVIEQLGALDERFFYYWEETEWCVRTRRAGWKIVHVPQAKLWHKGVQRDYRPKPAVTYYNTRNRFLLLQKHHAPVLIRTYAWAQTLRTLVSWSIKPRWRTQRGHRDAMWQGTRDFLKGRWGERPS